MTDAATAAESLTSLKAENEVLRELVNDLYGSLRHLPCSAGDFLGDDLYQRVYDFRNGAGAYKRDYASEPEHVDT